MREINPDSKEYRGVLVYFDCLFFSLIVINDTAVIIIIIMLSFHRCEYVQSYDEDKEKHSCLYLII